MPLRFGYHAGCGVARDDSCDGSQALSSAMSKYYCDPFATTPVYNYTYQGVARADSLLDACNYASNGYA